MAALIMMPFHAYPLRDRPQAALNRLIQVDSFEHEIQRWALIAIAAMRESRELKPIKPSKLVMPYVRTKHEQRRPGLVGWSGSALGKSDSMNLVR